MKKRTTHKRSFSDKLNLGITLIVIIALGLLFFYIYASAIFELLKIDPQLLTDTMIRSLFILCISCGIWFNLPVKLRMTIEVFIYSFGRAKHKYISMSYSSAYPIVLATKLPPTIPVRVFGLSLIFLGVAIWYFNS